MITLLSFFVLWMPQQMSASDSSLADQVNFQARHYVEQINLNQRTDLNLWALSALCQLQDYPELINYVNKQAKTSTLLRELGTPFCTNKSYASQLSGLAEQTNSQNLLLAAMLQEESSEARKQIYDEFNRKITAQSSPGDISFDSLFTHIINQSPIDSSVLPIGQFTFTHFLVLTNKTLRQQGIVTTDDYLAKMVDSWLSSEISFNNPSLIHSIYSFSLFKGLYYTRNFSKINTLYSGLTADKLFPISQERMTVYRFLDYIMNWLGYYDRSLHVSRNFSIPLTKFLNEKEKELNSRIMQGGYLLDIGKIRESQKVSLSVLEELQKHEVTVSKSSLLTNLGITYLKSGNIDKYFDLQFQALDLAKRQNNYNHQYQILRNLHVVYRSNGNQQSALRYINEALTLAKEYGKTNDLGSIYTSIGTFYREVKSKPDSASYYFQKAGSTINSEQNFDLYIDLLTEKGRLYEYSDQPEKALNIYSKLQKIVKSQEKSQYYLDALIDEGRMQIMLNRLNEVKKTVTELRNSDLSLLDFSDIVKAKTLEANYLIQTGQTEEAYNFLKPTISKVVERAQNSTDIQSGYWSVKPEYLNAFQLYVDLMIDTNRPQEAVLALDQLKTINDAELYQDPMVKSSQLNESELTQYQRLTNQLDQLRKKQLSASGKQRLDLQSRIDRLNAQKRALDRKITSYADQPTLGNIQQVQRQLSPKDVILHITELKDTYYLAQITKRNIHFQTVDLDTATRSLFDNAIQELATSNTDLTKLYQIGQLLNVSQLPARAENIIMIPDSYLFQLPLDILPVTDPAQNYSYGGTSYLIETYRTEYRTSLSELVFDSDTPKKSFTWNYVGFGITDFSDSQNNLMPLPYASREVRQISRELTNLEHHQTFLDEKSTEEAFRQTAPNARILHLATHSKVTDKDPLFSTIYMSSPPAQEPSEDQYENQIFAYELFEMNLTNDLIMLNSCESGSGSYLQGSGIVGISRALRFAGAESLVLNLWSVNDMMASDFAIQFYKSLNKGDTKAEALRKAKIHFLTHKNANPHYWGPYMMIGSNRPVVEPHRSANTLFASGFMAYLFLMMGLSYMVQRHKSA